MSSRVPSGTLRTDPITRFWELLVQRDSSARWREARATKRGGRSIFSWCGLVASEFIDDIMGKTEVWNDVNYLQPYILWLVLLLMRKFWNCREFHICKIRFYFCFRHHIKLLLELGNEITFSCMSPFVSCSTLKIFSSQLVTFSVSASRASVAFNYRLLDYNIWKSANTAWAGRTHAVRSLLRTPLYAALLCMPLYAALLFTPLHAALLRTPLYAALLRTPMYAALLRMPLYAALHALLRRLHQRAESNYTDANDRKIQWVF